MSLVKKPRFQQVDLDFADPLSDVMRNLDSINELVGQFNLIPKFQTDSVANIAYLKHIKATCAASATHKNCLRGVSKFAFGGQLEVIKSRLSGLKRKSSDVTEAEEAEFENALISTGINTIQLKNAIKAASRSMKESGDAYIYVRIEPIMSGVWATRIECIDYDEFMYWGGDGKDYKNLNDPKLGVWAPVWTQEALSDKDRHKVCGVSKIGSAVAEWTPIGKGFETIFHVKEGNSSKTYGELEIFPILNSMITEVLEDKKLSKTASSAVTALMMLFLPINPTLPEETNDNVGLVKKRFEEIGTNKGEGSELIVSEYYAEDGKPELVTLGIHRDAAWTQMVNDRVSGRMFGFHGWSAQLASMESRSTGLAQNAHLDELKKADLSTIQPLQETMEDVMSEMFTAIGRLTNTPTFVRNSLRFERIVEQFVQAEAEAAAKLKNTGNGIANNNGSNGRENVLLDK